MGDSIFRAFVRSYYDHFKGGNAETGDLEKIAEDVWHQDLHEFFNQWLYTPGVPMLSIQWQYNAGDQAVTVSVEQVQKQGLFHFPLELRLQGSKPAIITLTVCRQQETFLIHTGAPVEGVEPDPNTNLLFDPVLVKKKL